MVAAAAHKGLVELEVTPQQTVDALEAASFSAAASDVSSAAKVGHGLPASLQDSLPYQTFLLRCTFVFLLCEHWSAKFYH